MYNFSKTLFLGLGLLTHLNFSNGQSVEKTPSPEKVFMRITKAITSVGKNILSDVYETLPPNENLLISPLNIYHAIAVLHLAAEGNTLKELSDMMDIPPNKNYSKSIIHGALGNFYKQISTSDEAPLILNIADALFLRDGAEIKKNFLDQVIKYYAAEIENINFGNTKEAIKKINGWVSKKTRDRISNVVDENLDANTEAMVISTLYFNGRWANIFPKYKTKLEKFYDGEREIDVPMMNSVDLLPYVKSEEWQFESINIFYDSSDYVLNIILPYPSQTIKNLTRYLKDIDIWQTMEKSTFTGVDVKLPKMKFKKGTSLVKTFQQLGVRTLFAGANLKAMTEANLRMSEIFHGAEIEIDEEGTIATAATVMHIVPASAPIPIKKSVIFHVQRPFIFNIYHRKTSLYVFSGIVCKPVATS